jgi:hypothetical protein
VQVLLLAAASDVVRSDLAARRLLRDVARWRVARPDGEVEPGPQVVVARLDVVRGGHLEAAVPQQLHRHDRRRAAGREVRRERCSQGVEVDPLALVVLGLDPGLLEDPDAQPVRDGGREDGRRWRGQRRPHRLQPLEQLGRVDRDAVRSVLRLSDRGVDREDAGVGVDVPPAQLRELAAPQPRVAAEAELRPDLVAVRVGGREQALELVGRQRAPPHARHPDLLLDDALDALLRVLVPSCDGVCREPAPPHEPAREGVQVRPPAVPRPRTEPPLAHLLLARLEELGRRLGGEVSEGRLVAADVLDELLEHPPHVRDVHGASALRRRFAVRVEPRQMPDVVVDELAERGVAGLEELLVGIASEVVPAPELDPLVLPPQLLRAPLVRRPGGDDVPPVAHRPVLLPHRAGERDPP